MSPRWIPTKGQMQNLNVIFFCLSEQIVAQVVQLLLTWEALTLMLIGVHRSEVQGRIADAGKYRMIAPVPGSTCNPGGYGYNRSVPCHNKTKQSDNHVRDY